MKKTSIVKFGKSVRLIYAGDCYVSDQDEIIGTLLGSCISICLHDPVRKIGGMNHFMLPGKMNSVDVRSSDSAKYGISAISQLLDMMYRVGADKDTIQAKLFGGGAVLDIENKTTAIPDNNIRLARLMMEIEDIPIVEEDTGGKFVRKVYLDVESGKVYVRKTLRQLMIGNSDDFEDEGDL